MHRDGSVSGVAVESSGNEVFRLAEAGGGDGDPCRQYLRISPNPTSMLISRLRLENKTDNHDISNVCVGCWRGRIIVVGA